MIIPNFNPVISSEIAAKLTNQSFKTSGKVASVVNKGKPPKTSEKVTSVVNTGKPPKPKTHSTDSNAAIEANVLSVRSGLTKEPVWAYGNKDADWSNPEKAKEYVKTIKLYYAINSGSYK